MVEKDKIQRRARLRLMLIVPMRIVPAAAIGHLLRSQAELSSFNRSPSRRELRSPRSVNGKSLSPVCWPDRLHAVSPCLAR
jgi:hypothetical protein